MAPVPTKPKLVSLVCSSNGALHLTSKLFVTSKEATLSFFLSFLDRSCFSGSFSPQCRPQFSSVFLGCVYSFSSYLVSECVDLHGACEKMQHDKMSSGILCHQICSRCFRHTSAAVLGMLRMHGLLLFPPIFLSNGHHARYDEATRRIEVLFSKV